jgi:hypothetical protein
MGSGTAPALACACQPKRTTASHRPSPPPWPPLQGEWAWAFACSRSAACEAPHLLPAWALHSHLTPSAPISRPKPKKNKAPAAPTPKSGGTWRYKTAWAGCLRRFHAIPAPDAMWHGVDDALPRTTTVHKGWFGMIGRGEAGVKDVDVDVHV